MTKHSLSRTSDSSFIDIDKKILPTLTDLDLSHDGENTLHERLDRDKRTVSTIRTDITTIQGNLTSFNTEVTSVKARLDALETAGAAGGDADVSATEIITARDGEASLGARLTRDKNAVTALSGTVTGLNTSISTLSGKIDTNTGDITYIINKYNAINTEIVAARGGLANLNTRIAAGETRIGQLEGRMTDLNTVTSEVSTARDGLASLTARLTRDKNTVSALTSRVSANETKVTENKLVIDEVVAARGTHSNLSARLNVYDEYSTDIDSMESDIQDMLDNIADLTITSNSNNSEIVAARDGEVDLKTRLTRDKNDINSNIGSNLTKINTLTTEVTNARDGLASLTARLTRDKNAVGDITKLDTTDKSSVVKAVNELKTNTETVTGKLADLTTAAKLNLVAAINELKSADGSALAKIGDLSKLDTIAKSSVLLAVNELKSGLTNISNDIGGLSDLHTQVKSSIVAAINEINGKTAVDTRIGDLTQLTTTARDTLVNSINEVNASVSKATGIGNNLIVCSNRSINNYAIAMDTGTLTRYAGTKVTISADISLTSATNSIAGSAPTNTTSADWSKYVVGFGVAIYMFGVNTEYVWVGQEVKNDNVLNVSKKRVSKTFILPTNAPIMYLEAIKGAPVLRTGGSYTITDIKFELGEVENTVYSANTSDALYSYTDYPVNGNNYEIVVHGMTIHGNLRAALETLSTGTGNRRTLTTTTKTSLVEAINELVTKTNTTNTNIGDVSTLDTTAKFVVPAINEIKTTITNLPDKVGDLSTLNTGVKTSAVAAINELKNSNTALSTAVTNASNKVGDIATLNTTDKSDTVKAINEIVSKNTSQDTAINTNKTHIGTMANLNTIAKGDLVTAINEVKTNAALTTTVTPLVTEVTTARDGLTTLTARLDRDKAVSDKATTDLAALKTELDPIPAKVTAIDTRTTDYATIKGEVVAARGGLVNLNARLTRDFGKMGDLTKLTTTTKTDLVTAINEISTTAKEELKTAFVDKQGDTMTGDLEVPNIVIGEKVKSKGNVLPFQIRDIDDKEVEFNTREYDPGITNKDETTGTVEIVAVDGNTLKCVTSLSSNQWNDPFNLVTPLEANKTYTAFYEITGPGSSNTDARFTFTCYNGGTIVGHYFDLKHSEAKLYRQVFTPTQTVTRIPVWVTNQPSGTGTSLDRNTCVIYEGDVPLESLPKIPFTGLQSYGELPNGTGVIDVYSTNKELLDTVEFSSSVSTDNLIDVKLEDLEVEGMTIGNLSVDKVNYTIIGKNKYDGSAIDGVNDYSPNDEWTYSNNTVIPGGNVSGLIDGDASFVAIPGRTIKNHTDDTSIITTTDTELNVSFSGRSIQSPVDGSVVIDYVRGNLEYIGGTTPSSATTLQGVGYQKDGNHKLEYSTTPYVEATPVPMRYVRNSLNGSNRNYGNHWTEIFVVDDTGTNVALNKTVVGDPSHTHNALHLVTNGIYTDEHGYNMTSPEDGNWAWVQIDLGKIYTNIESIKLWHYFGSYLGDRQYNQKLEVSADGTNWTKIFDSATDGAYIESSAGKSFEVPKVSSRVSDPLSISIPKPLCKIGSVYDAAYNDTSIKIDYKITKHTFTGNDITNVSANPGGTVRFDLAIPADFDLGTFVSEGTAPTNIICDKLPVKAFSEVYAGTPGISTWGYSSNTAAAFLNVGFGTNLDLNGGKAYLNANPITIYCISKNPTTVDTGVIAKTALSVSSSDTIYQYSKVTGETHLANDKLLCKHLDPSTKYTVSFSRSKPGTLTFTLAGVTGTTDGNSIVITTPSTIMNNYLSVIGAAGCEVSNVVIAYGDDVANYTHIEGMKSLGEEEGEIRLRTVGGNLFSVTSFIQESKNKVKEYGNGISFESLVGSGIVKIPIHQYKSNTQYQLSFDKESSNGHTVFDIHYTDNTVQSDATANGHIDMISHQGKTISYIETNYTSGFNITKFTNIILCEYTGTTQPYEPYKEITNEIQLPAPIRSIPGSNVRDDVFYDGSITRRIETYTLTGDEFIRYGGGGATKYYYIDLTVEISPSKPGGAILCNNFATRSYTEFDSGSKKDGITTHPTVASEIRIAHPTIVNDVPRFTQWLKDNPTTIYYELTSPEPEKIDSLEIKALGNTSYFVDNSLPPKSLSITTTSTQDRTDFIRVVSNTEYAISFNGIKASRRVNFYNASKYKIGEIQGDVITTPSDCFYIKVLGTYDKLQVEIGNTHSKLEAYREEILDIPIPRDLASSGNVRDRLYCDKTIKIAYKVTNPEVYDTGILVPSLLLHEKSTIHNNSVVQGKTKFNLYNIYKLSRTSIALPQPLRGVNNVKDKAYNDGTIKIDQKNGYTNDLYTNKTWTLNSITGSGYARFSSGDFGDIPPNINVLCNLLQPGTYPDWMNGDNIDKEFIYKGEASLCIVIKSTTANNLTTFNSWLRTSGIQIMYNLTTPKTIDTGIKGTMTLPMYDGGKIYQESNVTGNVHLAYGPFGVDLDIDTKSISPNKYSAGGIDLGSEHRRFRDGYFDGVVEVDTIKVKNLEVNGGGGGSSQDIDAIKTTVERLDREIGDMTKLEAPDEEKVDLVTMLNFINNGYPIGYDYVPVASDFTTVANNDTTWIGESTGGVKIVKGTSSLLSVQFNVPTKGIIRDGRRLIVALHCSDLSNTDKYAPTLTGLKKSQWFTIKFPLESLGKDYAGVALYYIDVEAAEITAGDANTPEHITMQIDLPATDLGTESAYIIKSLQAFELTKPLSLSNARITHTQKVTSELGASIGNVSSLNTIAKNVVPAINEIKTVADKLSGAIGAFKFWEGSLTDFNAITVKDNNTFYFVRKDSTLIEEVTSTEEEVK